MNQQSVLLIKDGVHVHCCIHRRAANLTATDTNILTTNLLRSSTLTNGETSLRTKGEKHKKREEKERETERERELSKSLSIYQYLSQEST